MEIDGSHLEILTPKEQNTIHPNWSSDSKQVIYCTNDDLEPPKKNTAEINAVDLATRKVRPLITGGVNTYGSWSPDMKQIVFRKIVGEEKSEVFLANADGSNQRNLTNNPFFDGWPGVVIGWKEDRLRLQSPRPWLPDLCHGPGWDTSHPGCKHRRTRNSASLVAGRENNLLYQLCREGLRGRL